MKILAISDNHGDCVNVRRVAELERDIDLVFHLGDFVRTDRAIKAIFDVPVDFVPGNMDFDSILPEEAVIKKCGFSIFLTHGHLYMARMGSDVIAAEAASRGASIALYGHTHMPSMGYIRGVMVCNPGSISRPRQADRRPSYGILTLTEGREPEFEIKYLLI